MITTTFVIGAGASVPYGFPVASKLKDDICRSPPTVLDDRDRQIYDPVYHEVVNRESKQNALALSLSGQASIDSWLSLNPERADWGKLGISRHLVPIELKCVHASCSDWYAWFFQKFHNRNGLRTKDFRIVTFNYDRSLEVALVQMLMNSLKMSLQSALQYLETVPICHVYGRLEVPTLQRLVQGDHRVTDRDFIEASKGIRVMSDERPGNDGTLSKARQWCLEAHKLVFLGFSFDYTNLERIGIHPGSRDWVGGARSIIASGYGLLEAEREVATSRVMTAINFAGPQQTCLECLRSRVDWLA